MEKKTTEDIQPKPVKDRDNMDLLELVCELHSRALAYPSKEMHDASVEARSELENRIKYLSKLTTPQLEMLTMIHDYVTDQRTELDQITELMYWNSGAPEDCSVRFDPAPQRICKSVGVRPLNKGAHILGELIRLYRKIYGPEFELKFPPTHNPDNDGPAT